MSEVMQDLEAPMRPNVSSYESGSNEYAKKDRAQSDRRIPEAKSSSFKEVRAVDPSGEIGDSLTEEMMGDGSFFVYIFLELC